MLEEIPVPPMFRAAVEFFNTGDFVLSYEMAEQAWATAPDPARNFLKGFLQTAAGLAKLQQDNYAGAVSLLATGLELLEPFEPAAFGIDVTNLVDAAAAILNQLHRLGPDRLTDVAALPMPRIHKL